MNKLIIVIVVLFSGQLQRIVVLPSSSTSFDVYVPNLNKVKSEQQHISHFEEIFVKPI